MWVNHSGRSPKMSDHEQFAQVAHQKWATMNELFRSLTKNEQMSKWANRSFFGANSQPWMRLAVNLCFKALICCWSFKSDSETRKITNFCECGDIKSVQFWILYPPKKKNELCTVILCILAPFPNHYTVSKIIWISAYKTEACHGWSRRNGICPVSVPDMCQQKSDIRMYTVTTAPSVSGTDFMRRCRFFFLQCIQTVVIKILYMASPEH